MGLGGYITLYNDTDYDLKKGAGGAYQMRFQAPDLIPAHESRRFYVEWGQSGSVADDDSAYADYVVQDGTGRVVTIEAWARGGKHFQMHFKSYSQPGYPIGKIVNIGWQHDGTVGFHITQPVVPKPDPCFLKGSLILTREGYKPVETITPEETVITMGDHGHEFRKVIYVGHSRRIVDAAEGLGPDEAGWPVCIRADAFGPRTPRRDLWLTSEHCVLVGDRLIPIRMLVNGVSIFYDRRRPVYDYYHIATRTHSIILAENLCTESYLPGDNEAGFTMRQGSLAEITAPFHPARPIVTDRAVVEPLYRALAGLGQDDAISDISAGQMTDDPDLHLALPCGMKIAPISVEGGIALFSLGAGVERVFIRSRAGRPCDTVGRFIDDRRRLGVLIGAVTVQDMHSRTTREIDFQDPSLNGWHDPEQNDTRWTAGSAELVLPETVQANEACLAVRIVRSEAYRL